VSKFRDKETYYGQHGNFSLSDLYSGSNINISMEEIYAIEYNSSIYQFRASAKTSHSVNLDIVEIALLSISGFDGQKQSINQLGLSFYTSKADKCASFSFLLRQGAQKFHLRLQMFAEQGANPSLRGIMSLPNQVRSFDRFRLFTSKSLHENRQTNMEYAVHSLKFMQKRNTGGNPCVDVDNYDKVILDKTLAKCMVMFNNYG